jgi:hypothetical protein
MVNGRSLLFTTAGKRMKEFSEGSLTWLREESEKAKVKGEKIRALTSRLSLFISSSSHGTHK